MKKIILSILVVCSSLSQAQMQVSNKVTGVPITNGQIYSFNSTTYALAELPFRITNTSNAAINVKVRCEAITNTDGTGMELCIGPICLSDVAVGDSYPSTPVVIPANGTNGNFEHFYNSNVGDGTNYPMDYTFKFYQINGSGAEVGNSVTFTYRFNPNLNTQVNQLQNVGVAIKSNTIESQLDLQLSNTIQIELFDLNGRKVLTQNLDSGSHSIDVSNLQSSVYILNFTDEKGKKANAKIIKK
jgi:hypothetical protein